MKNIIFILFSISLASCGAIHKITKNSLKLNSDSLFTKTTDSAIITSSSGVKDSTGVSNWQKETIIEYYRDYDNLDTMSVSNMPIINPKSIKSSNIKRIIIREKTKDSTRLIINKNESGDSKISKTDNVELKKVSVSNTLNKEVAKKPIWPYLLGLLALLASGAYLYFKKINPLSYLTSILKIFK